jgi:phosphoglycerol transferase MdoB-like AlkP superfamily enzyme/tetratricopeptide (TPR) repeat protein
MKFRIQKKNIYKYIYLSISLICVFWLISALELYLSISSGIKASSIGITMLYKFLNDFWSGLIIGIILFPIFMLLNLFLTKGSVTVVKVVFLLFVLIQFSLVKYSLTTLLNLGADILGYSLNDIYITVSSSEEMSLMSVLPFVVFPLLFFILYIVINKYFNERITLGVSVVVILLFGSLKLIFSEASDAAYQNKIAFLTIDIIKFQKEKSKANAYNLFDRNDYPLLKPFNNSNDVLSSFFNVKEEKPNIVIVIVEGLGSEFIGKKTYRGFTPYLDSLITKSLYWENFVSTTGRTFGVVPSLLGSLPFGETGFLELPKTPSHISLISILKANGYTTSYYSGDQSSFDKKINFFEYSDIDNVIDENKFGLEYVKTEANSGGFSWGYPDAEIFKKTLASLDNKSQPRLDIIMTLTNHEPFNFPSKEAYLTKVDSLLNSNKSFGVPKEEINTYKDIFATLLYTDNSIKEFMSRYAERPEFENTIFIITGDHRLIPITQKDKLCRFHVPLYVYSPMLKKAEKFKSISSHWDVTPSLLSFLMNNYKFNSLDETAWMSQGLDTARYFRNIHRIPLMRYKGNINDFIYKDYLYSDGDLFKINESFGIYEVIEEELIKTMKDSLAAFKKMNAYVTQRNKIFPDSLNIYVKPHIEFSIAQQKTINELTKGLNFDQTFEIAREKAFNKERRIARLLCDYILNELPNHADARTLKGRTLAWDGDYLNAEVELLNVIKRSPYYDDAYLALLDLYWWSDQDKKAIELVSKALKNGLTNPELSFKLAKAYKRMESLEQTAALMDSIIQVYPNNPDYITFKKTLELR